MSKLMKCLHQSLLIKYMNENTNNSNNNDKIIPWCS